MLSGATVLAFGTGIGWENAVAADGPWTGEFTGSAWGRLTQHARSAA